MKEIDDSVLKVNQYILDHKKMFNLDFGNKLKDYRKENNISLYDFSSMCLMTSNQMAQIENGKNGITLNKFVIICNSLGCLPNELLENFLYSAKTNDDILFSKLQQGKSISRNVFDYIISKK